MQGKYETVLKIHIQMTILSACTPCWCHLEINKIVVDDRVFTVIKFSSDINTIICQKSLIFITVTQILETAEIHPLLSLN